MFISIDGIDGAGKTTQIELLCEWLRSAGQQPLRLRDPGSTDAGEDVRRIVLESEYSIGGHAETLLYMAARAQLVDEQIRPAVESGRIVICDRFLLANVVYQSVHWGIDPAEIWTIGSFATRGTKPDLTILLDLPAQEAATRLSGPRDRLESRGDDYLEQVRQAFLSQLSTSGTHTCVIDATQPVERIAADIRGAVINLQESEQCSGRI